MANNYRVNFFKLIKEEKEKGKVEITGKEYLGSVTLDDSRVNGNDTLTALAFRRATAVMQLADRVEIEQVR